jgi:hypothetical protein
MREARGATCDVKVLCNLCHQAGYRPPLDCISCHKIDTSAPMMSMDCGTCHLKEQEVEPIVDCKSCHRKGEHPKTDCTQHAISIIPGRWPPETPVLSVMVTRKTTMCPLSAGSVISLLQDKEHPVTQKEWNWTNLMIENQRA